MKENANSFTCEKDALDNIKYLLKCPNIKRNNDVLSLYYIYKNIKMFISNIYDLANNDKYLVNLINQYNKTTYNLNKNIIVNHISVNMEGNLDDTAKILFEFKDTNSGNIICNYLCKNPDNYNLYWEKKYPRLNNLVTYKFLDDFMNLFILRENFICFLLGDRCLPDENNTYSLTVENEIIEATIYFDQRLHYSHYINFNMSDEDINKIDSDMNLRYYIAFKELNIMKKIPVKIDSLNNVFRNILSYNDDKKKIKSIIRNK